jgi:hypothetical protein
LPGHDITAAPVVSYTAFSPSPPKGLSVSVALSRAYAPRVLPGILLYGAQTFLDADLLRRAHPANLKCSHHNLRGEISQSGRRQLGDVAMGQIGMRQLGN